MTNSALGLYAPLASSSTHTVTANSMATTDGWYDIPQTQRWTIQTNASGGYVTLLNAFSDNGGYLATPSNSTNGAAISTTTTLSTNCRWILERYTGEKIDSVKMTSFKSSVECGQSFTYTAYMYDDQIGVNGPVTYRVGNNDYSATDKATIDSNTGELTALKSGAIKVGVTYQDAPWIWWFSIRITPYYGCKSYYHINAGSGDSYSMNCQGYAFWTHDNPQGWCSSSQWITILNNCSTSNEALFGNSSTVGIKYLLENNWLNIEFSGRWKEVTSSNGGWDIALNNNQWIVAFRVGKDSSTMDYHFWYRTDSGEWSNKHGFMGTGSQSLGTDVPTDNYSVGWKLSSNAQFYNSDIIYYVITE